MSKRNYSADEIIKQIDEHIRNLYNSRALCPTLKKDMIGQTQYRTAPFYSAEGYDAIVKFAEPLTDQKIDGLNDAGHWINQGFVIRLAALLQSCQIIGTKGSGIQLIPGLDGYEEVSILRELRNAFAHSSGKYDSTDSDKRKLYNRVIKHFSLDPKQYPEEDGKFPIPIDKVLVPLAKGCKKYVRAVHQQGILRDTLTSKGGKK